MYYVLIDKETNYALYANSEAQNPPSTSPYYEVNVEDNWNFNPPLEVAYWLYDSQNKTFSFVSYKPQPPSYPVISQVDTEHQSNDVFFVSSSKKYYYIYRKSFSVKSLNGGNVTTLGITNIPHGISGLNINENFPLILTAHAMDANGKSIKLPTAYGTLLNGYVTLAVDSTNIIISTNISLTGIKAYIQLEYTKANNFYKL